MIKDVNYFNERAQIIRRTINDMIFGAESGHFGASLSSVDFINVIYENYVFPENAEFILSKGHAAPALYAKLIESGVLDKDFIYGFREYRSLLTGHPNHRIPTLKFGLGSLGQGPSIGVGMAWVNKRKKSDKKIFVMLGDGELNEGQVWEAFYTCRNLNLQNLVFIIDRNFLQLDGKCEDVANFPNLAQKISSFLGTNPIEVNGNSYDEILNVLDNIDYSQTNVIISNTTKGKGIEFMEGKTEFHSYNILSSEKEVLYKRAMECLGGDKMA